MLVKEITETLYVEPTPADLLPQRQREYDQAVAMLKQIDKDGDGVSELTAQGIVQVVDTWIKDHPNIISALKLLPQTRLALTVVQAATAISKGNTKQALQAVATIAGGGLAQNLTTAAKGMDIAQNVQAGHYADAAKQALDFVPNSDRAITAIDTGQKVAQGDYRGAAVNMNNPMINRADDLAGTAERAYRSGSELAKGDISQVPKLAQATGLDKKIKTEDLARIRQLSGIS